MRPKSFTVVGSAGGATVSPAFVVDKYNNPINIGIGVVVSGVHSIADVQHTFADVGEINVNSAVSAVAWIDNSTLVSATQAGQKNGAWDTNYAFAPSAIRVKIRAFSSASAGERVTMTVIQAGPED